MYFATVLDLFSRRIIGWSMDKNIDRHLVIRALMMAVWQRQPKGDVLIHSDQGSQYGSADYLSFLKTNNLKPSMSRRGNCHDNAVAESFFATFKKRVTQRKIYSTRDDAKTEIFNFIEMFYNPVKRHSHTGGVSPVQFEKDYFSRLERLRKSSGLTQQELSESAEVSRKSINAIENGIYVPSTVLSLKIAKTLKCSVEDLFQLP